MSTTSNRFSSSAEQTSGSSTTKRPRVRRGNSEDHEALRRDIVAAAFRLSREPGGLQAMSMRTLAAEVGMSAMGLYRYFESKTAVLQAMWDRILMDATASTAAAAAAAIKKGANAREAVRTGIDAYIAYFEANPEHFVLVFMMEDGNSSGEVADYTRTPGFIETRRLAQDLTEAFIKEVGGDLGRFDEIRELRAAFMVGYLHSKLVNRRYPWTDLAALRRNAIDSIMLSMEACAKQPALAKKAAKKRAG